HDHPVGDLFERTATALTDIVAVGSRADRNTGGVSHRHTSAPQKSQNRNRSDCVRCAAPLPSVPVSETE
ncbi:MAG: hypothetical protein RLZZ140_668, partial [Pseudomonadota bacterium]